MYDPNVGRFLEEDPIGVAGGDTNFYRYCENSPTNLTDPSGLQPGWWVPDTTMDPMQATIWANIRESLRLRGLTLQLFTDIEAEDRTQIACSGAGPTFDDGSLRDTVSLPRDEYEVLLLGGKGADDMRGILRSGDMGDLFNELFSAWMHQRVYPHASDQGEWLIELMQAEQYPLTRKGRYDKGLEMAEEAMSETVSRIVAHLCGVSRSVGTVRGPGASGGGDVQGFARNTRKIALPTIDLKAVKQPPGHTDDKEKWFGIAAAERPISDTLTIACIWVLENGITDPKSSYAGSTTAQALLAWYNARWSPTRPANTAVDRLGNPK